MLIDFINEAFQDDILEIDKLQGDDKTVKQLLVLSKKKDKLGNYQDIEDYTINNFLKDIYSFDKKAYDELKKLKYQYYDGQTPVKEKPKIAKQFVNGVYKFYSKHYKKAYRKGDWYLGQGDKIIWATGNMFTDVLLSIIEFLSRSSNNLDKEQTKLVAKLASSFEKLTDMKIEDIFNEKKTQILSNIEAHNKKLESESNLWKEIQKHNYLYVATSPVDSGFIEIVFFKSKDVESYDELASLVEKGEFDIKSAIACTINNKVTLPFNCGNYYFSEDISPENAVKYIGYLDELPKELFKFYQGYQDKPSYRGTLYSGKKYPKEAGHYYDSLWNKYTR